MLKAAFARADNIDYRFGGATKKRKAKATAPSIPAQEEGTILLSGILNENTTNDLQEPVPTNQDEDVESISDDGSNCDIEESAFAIGVDDDVDNSPLVDNEDDIDYIGDGWVWNKWKEIGDDEEIPGPKEYDHYNGRHGLKDGIGERFITILQCIFETKDLLHSQTSMQEQK